MKKHVLATILTLTTLVTLHTQAQVTDQNHLPVIGLLSAHSSPDQLSQMQSELKDYGITMEIKRLIWNDEQNQISEIDFTYKASDSDVTKRYSHQFNDLNPGQIFVMFRGEKEKGAMLLVNIDQALAMITDEYFTPESITCRIVTSFSPSFLSTNITTKNSVMIALKSYQHSGSSL